MLTRLPRRGSKKGPQEEQTRGPSPSGSHARRRDHARSPPAALSQDAHPPASAQTPFPFFLFFWLFTLLPAPAPSPGESPRPGPWASPLSGLSFTRHCRPCHSALSFPLGRLASLSRTGTSRRAGQCLILDKDKCFGARALGLSASWSPAAGLWSGHFVLWYLSVLIYKMRML